MNLNNVSTKLYNIGLSYKKADVKSRGAFNITPEDQILLLEDAKKRGIDGVFVLSTCNRTEITGFASHPFELISLLIKYSKGTVEDFTSVSNIYKKTEAIDHLFEIGVGLDSQILGDYEIVGQLKKSFLLAKEMGTTNAYLERLMNLVLQASKNVKNNTKLSSGTTSVSYAATQYIIDNIPDYNTKNILTYGLGDMGKNTCKNLLEYTTNRNVTLINRTYEKAIAFKNAHPEVNIQPSSSLKEAIDACDILIVSTAANLPIINKEHLAEGKELLIIDLSVPANVNTSLKHQDGVTLVNIDELSKITSKTLETRENQVPLAKNIIAKHKEEFMEWISHRKFVPTVNALKESLQTIQHNEIDFQSKKLKDFNPEHVEIVSSRIIQKITTQFVKYLKQDDTEVDESLEIISKIFNLNENA